MTPGEQTVETPHGPGRAVVSAAADPIATLVLSHGAGNGIDTGDLVALAEALPTEGITVVRFEQPWKVAGRKIATAPPTLDAGLTACVEALADSPAVAGRLVVGGRSAGARSAARSASALGASCALCLSFPLHPPGRPEKSRLAELEGAGVPVLIVQGERDPMGRPEEFPDDPRLDLTTIPAADHSLRVARTGPITQEDAHAIIVESALEWITREVVG